MNILISLILAALPVAIPDPKLMSLVRQLGHQSFAVRETASRELVKAGTAAVPALTVGIKSGDAEVAGRCKQLLPIAASFERNQKLAELLKEPLGPPPKGLAGVERFLKITGDNKDTRRLYAEMMAAHHATIEALETDTEAAARLLYKFFVEARDRSVQADLAGQDPFDAALTDRGQATLFWFVRSDPRFDDTRLAEGSETMFLLRATKMKTTVVGPEEVPGMKKLFLHWLAAERREDEMLTAYKIAKAGKMKEALPLALKAINDPGKDSGYRVWLMIDFLAEMGSREHIKNLAPLLAEEAEGLGSLKSGDGPTLSPQLRDVALGVSILLAGQKPSDFGLHAGRFGDREYREYYGGYGFIDSDARDKAQAKWKAWLAKQELTPKK